MNRLLFVLLVLVNTGVKAQPQQRGVDTVVLQTIEGKKYDFNKLEELSVIIFLSPSCPLSQKYTRTLNELSKEFSGKVKFYGVFAETDPVPNDYKHFKKKYRIPFQLLVDREKALVKVLNATVTPESFVLYKGQLIYQGAIDDWAIDLGKTKRTATTNFVRTAIQCAMANTTPLPAYRKPVGCFID